MNPQPVSDPQIPLRPRPGLQFNALPSRNGLFFAVKDPVSLSYCVLTQTQKDLLSELETAPTREHCRAILQSKHPDVDVRLVDIDGMLLELSRMHLVVSSRGGLEAFRSTRKTKELIRRAFKFVANPLFVRLPGIRPRTSLSIADSALGWLFTKFGFLSALVLFALTAALVKSKLDTQFAKVPDFQQFFGWPNLAYLWLSIGVTKVIHEFGHAVACRRMGCECHEIGFALLLFSPTLYCNANDAWMLKSRWARIVVSLGGMYFELLFAMLCGAVWCVTEPGMANYLCFNVLAIASANTVLFNANPLIKFDGYYALSDTLRIVNLQQVSQKAFLRVLFSLIGRETSPSIDEPASGLSGYVLYSLAAYVYRIGILLGAAATALLVLRPKGLASLAFLFAGYAVACMIVQQLNALRHAWKQSRRLPGATRKSMLFGGALAASFVLMANLPIPWLSVASCRLLPADVYPLRTATEGRLEEVFIRAPCAVHVGERIASFSNHELQVRLIRAEEEIGRAEAELRLLQASDEHQQWTTGTEQLARLEAERDELLQQLRQLNITAVVDGFLVPGDLATIRDAVGDVEFTVQPLSPENIGLVTPRGTTLGVITPGRSKRKHQAVAYVNVDDAIDLTIGASVRIRLGSQPTSILSAVVTDIGLRSEEDVVETPSRATDGAAPRDRHVQVRVEWDGETAYVYAGTGQIYYYTWQPSLLAILGRVVYRFIYFG